MSGQDPCAHGCTEPELGVSTENTLGASQADSRIAAWQALHPAAGHDWLKQLAHAAG
jgi:hypothetical protein